MYLLSFSFIFYHLAIIVILLCLLPLLWRPLLQVFRFLFPFSVTFVLSSPSSYDYLYISLVIYFCYSLPWSIAVASSFALCFAFLPVLHVFFSVVSVIYHLCITVTCIAYLLLLPFSSDIYLLLLSLSP